VKKKASKFKTKNNLFDAITNNFNNRAYFDTLKRNRKLKIEHTGLVDKKIEE